MEPVKVFWGLVLKPEKRYQQVAEESFHISKACLEPTSAGKGITSVYIEVDNDEFIVCNLNKEGVMSDSLDLNFVAGEKICFRNVGTGTVHLTGYLMPDEEEMPSFYEEGEEEESEEEEMPALTEAGKKNKRKMLEVLNGGKASKKAKAAAMDEGDDDDEDVEEAIKKAVLMKKKIMKTSTKVEQNDDDDDDDDDDEDGDEDDDEDDDDDEDEEEEGEDEEDDDDEPVEVEPTSNGKAAKKSPEKSPKKAAGETPGKKGQENKTPKKTPAKGQENGATPGNKTPKRTLKGGIQVQDIKIGSGPEAKRGKHVGMLYEGRLASNGKVFDGNFKTQKPFKFRLGAGEVIKGWDIGVEGMKVNGVRELIIPAKMGYGAQGAPPDIPPNAMLKFKVECKYVN